VVICALGLKSLDTAQDAETVFHIELTYVELYNNNFRCDFGHDVCMLTCNSHSRNLLDPASIQPEASSKIGMRETPDGERLPCIYMEHDLVCVQGTYT
jgi:hypothetical protein